MNGSEHILITGARIVTEEEILFPGALYVKDGKIALAGHQEEIEQKLKVWQTSPEQILDAKGGWLLPGFIDVHVHGGSGSDFMQANVQAFDEITVFHARHGTTAMLATTVTASKDEISGVLKAVHAYMQTPMPGAQLLGVHLEGPFISPKWPGAQNPAHIVPPQKSWMEEWVAQYPGLIRILTLAPEREGALDLIEWATGRGILCACGHTDATYEQMAEALDRGLRHSVHAFNAMRPLHHREPGTVGAVLAEERISTEIIADGHHVHEACIRLLARVKNNDHLLLVTDAISAAGLGDGEYELGGLPVIVEKGVARLKEGGSLAGSTLTMIDAFRHIVNNVGLSIELASKMASGNPAKLLGIYSRTGSIAAGKRADLLLASPGQSFEPWRVWAAGKTIYAKPGI